MITDMGSGWSLAAAFGNPGAPCFQRAIYRNMPAIVLGPDSAGCSALGPSSPVNLYVKHESSASWTDCGDLLWQRAQNAANSATLYVDRVDGAARCQAQDPAF